MLFALAPISVNPILLGIGVAVLFALIGSYIFRKNTRLEHLRAAFREASNKLRERGWDDLAKVFDAFVIGDVSGMIDEAWKLVQILIDPVRGDAFLAAASIRHLKHAMEVPEWRTKVFEEVDNFRKVEALKFSELIKKAKAEEAVAAAAAKSVGG